MPIRINLKEMFGSDSQGITVDKINYNFNRLLELGIGTQGIQGITGPQGSAGPIGSQGAIGTRGSLWYVASGNPNTPLYSPTGLRPNDLYIDSITADQYQWNGTAWQVAAIIGGPGGVISNAISVATSIAFVRELQILAGNTDRYITFKTKNNVGGDGLNSSGSDNDILFLNNFNETNAFFGTTAVVETDLYTALARINVRNFGVPGRYHIQLGTYFDDTLDLYSGNDQLTQTKHDLKIRHVVDTNFPAAYSGNEYQPIAKFSLSKTEQQALTSIDYNGIFEFINPKWDAATMTVAGAGLELVTRIGSREGLGEKWTGNNIDGISFNIDSIDAGIGIAYKYSHPLDNFNDENYLFLEGDNNINSVFVNNKLTQDSGNIEQLGSRGATELSKGDSVSGQSSGSIQMYGNAGVVKVGSNIITIDGVSASEPGISLNDPGLYGRLNFFDVTDPSNVNQISSTVGNQLSNLNPFKGAGLCDIKVSGNLIYTIHNTFKHDYINGFGALPDMQVFEYNEQGSQLTKKINQLYIKDSLESQTVDPGDTELTQNFHRIEIAGDVAIVSTQGLRSWGTNPVTNTSSSNNFYGWASSGGAPILLIDISKPKYGISVARKKSNPTDFSIANFANTSNEAVHALDLAVREEYAYILAVNFTDAGSNILDYDVKVLRANWKKDFIIGSNGYSTNIYTGSGVTSVNHQTILSKFGTISINGKYLYAMYRNQIHTYDIERYDWQENQATGNPGGILEVDSDIWDVDSEIRALDSKIAGNSLYVLYSTGTGAYGIDGNSGIVKMDIRDPEKPYAVWKKQLTVPNASRMIIDGNHIYVTTSGDFNKTELVSIEVDGIITDHINAGIIKADELAVGKVQTPSLNAEIANVEKIQADTLSIESIVVDNYYAPAPYLMSPNYIGVPIGGIIMWSGLSSDIANPNRDLWNYRLCNGSPIPTTLTDPSGRSVKTVYQSPDSPPLSDRFIVASGGAYPIGSTGGNESIQLEIGQMPQHKHDVVVGGSRAKIDTAPDEDNGAQTRLLKGASGTPLGSGDTSQQADHIHPVSEALKGNGDPIDIRPKYYALAYIIRIA